METVASSNTAIDVASSWSGVLRVGVASAVVAVLLLGGGSTPFQEILVYPALVAAVLYGVLLMARPGSLLRREAVARMIPDAFLVSVLVAGTGGGTSMFFILYTLVALELVRVRVPARAAVGAAGLVGGYVTTVMAVGGPEALVAPAVVWRVGELLFCFLMAVLGVRFGELLERLTRVSSEVAAQTERAEKAEGIVSGLGAALTISSVERTLLWATEAAHAVVGGSYAHAAALDGYQHHTICSGESSVCPTWWHPEIQRLLLWSCREGKPVRSDGQVHGIGSFLAVPIGPVEGEWWGALIAGGEGLGEAEEQALRLVAAAAAAALAGVREAPAGRDQASGLPNRASLERVLARELSQGRTFTLLVAELAPQGVRRSPDAMLLGVSEGLAEARHRAFRYGRDEFAVIMGGTGESRARRTAAALRQLVLNEAGRDGNRDVAVGFAFSETGEKDPERLLRTAHRSLAEAREQVGGVAGPPAAVVEPATEDAATLETVRALVKILTYRDPHIKDHLEAVAGIAGELGGRISLPEPEMSALIRGALLHDVGKIDIPDRILRKAGPLTNEEYDTIKRHPAIGARMISLVKELLVAVPVVLYHHERFDGRGYPAGLRGSEIPHIARIVAVADAYDAMVRGRPYENAIPRKMALQKIQANAGTQFDPQIVQTLTEVLEATEKRSTG